MNFEKVELFGFKSFADKAEIKFSDGVTCIVGPNGCGKSNIADAIRWVLGEQSAKSLRGANMQDVIFKGTQTRKGISYCEVSLFFDNSNKIFNIEFEEVIVTRKLFRSGESEYYINKQPARMRDIVNLLREVGVGKEGYTIIGQGRVEEIVSAKPEDRRAIFEEATGISKFKSQKDENERRLNRTKENITRLMDIMAEKENRLGPLEKQANKTREYNELTTSLRHHELNTYISKVDSVGEDKEKINTRIRGLNDQLSLRNSELDKNEKEYADMMNEFNSLHKTLSDLNHKYTELCVTAEQRAGQNSLLTARIGFFNGEIEKAQADIKKNEERLTQNKLSIKDAKDTIEQCKKELATIIAEDEELSAQIVVLNEKIAVGESIEKESNKKIISSIENLADRKQVKSATDTELNNYSERAEELRSKIEGLDDKREKCFNDIENCDKEIIKLNNQIEKIKEDIINAENGVRALNESVAGCDSKIYNLNSTLSTLKAREGFYRSAKDNYEGYNEAVKQLQQRAKNTPELKKKIVALVGEVISCEKRFDTAIEILLGNAVQNIITETTDDAKYIIAYLKNNGIKRITFLPLDSVKSRDIRQDVVKACSERGAIGDATKIVKYDVKFERVISSLLGNTLVVDNLDNATRIAEKFGKTFRIVTLEGDVISTQGAITGGSTKKDVHGLLSNDRRIEDVVKQIKDTQAEMDVLTAEKKNTERERDNALDALDALEDSLVTAKQNKLLQEQKKDGLNQDMAEFDVELASAKEVLVIVEDKITALILRLKTTSDLTAELEKERKDLSVDAEKNLLQSETLKKKKEELLSRQTEIKIGTNALRTRIDSLKSDIVNLQNDNDGIKENSALLEKDIVNKQEIIADIKKQQALTAMTNEERVAMDKLRAEIEGIEDRSGELKNLLEERSQKRISIQEEINNISDKVHIQEIALTKIDSDLEYLQKTVWEDYGETYETAQSVKEENYDVSFGLTEIERIRKRRNFLGSINANALEDYRLELESYQELQTQKEDLDKAEADIRSVLETLKTEMVETFDEGFKQINENFGKIFKELFGGGRAMLELDYSIAEDKLEAGVEIKVEPPGKKMQRLSLLSGGEKALTAIAILFAILRLKPMAFCVLDEIEAALDEANVDRFARYLKKFSTETQFIVITHRKPTMELADTLFGVTMEEKGVSKLVSVKLSDAVKYDEKN